MIQLLYRKNLASFPSINDINEISYIMLLLLFLYSTLFILKGVKHNMPVLFTHRSGLYRAYPFQITRYTNNLILPDCGQVGPENNYYTDVQIA